MPEDIINMKNNICLLTRFDIDTEEEEKFASEIFENCVSSRMQVPANSLVIGRYSVLPFYNELEKDLNFINSKLINNFSQHKFIADIEKWYPIVEDISPKTWFSRWDLIPEGKYVVKGKTNSRKFKWNTHMFADCKQNLQKVINRLYDDAFISEQGICVREYVPLKTYDIGMNGMPFTNEWRLFFLGNELVSYGYYWSIYERENPEDLPKEAIDFAQMAAKRVSEHTNFFVLDIAQKEDGEWILIEINDGQMSGLSTIDPSSFYKNLLKVASDSYKFDLLNEGPKTRVLLTRSCRNCFHCETKYYAIQGDSGYDVSCKLAKREIGDSTWATPNWCPIQSNPEE